MCVDVFGLCVCVFLCRRRADSVNITAAMCLFPRVLVCGVSVISAGLNSQLPSIYNLYVYTLWVCMFLCAGQAY